MATHPTFSSSLFHPLSSIVPCSSPTQPNCSPISIDSPSTRPQRPIIICPFSILLIAINMNQTLINIYKTITYAPIRPFTNVKNVRQILLFMQNKPNSRFCAGKKFNDDSLCFTREHLPPYKGVLCKTNPNGKIGKKGKIELSSLK